MNTKIDHIHNWPELARQANWSAATMAKLCGVSANTLRRHFLQKAHKTPGAWLAEQRQHRAIELLRDGSSIKETASCLGYKQQTNFTRKFKEFWGACPSLQSPVHLTKAQNERK
jgi:AraC-like DNA-binding protein